MRKTDPRSTRSQAPQGRTVSIIGTGSYLPEKILTNAELEQMVETSDEWIISRTGIRERRIAGEEEATSDMAVKAALAAMQQAGVTADELDMIIVATVSPDMLFPSTACFVQKKLRAMRASAFDVSAACSGFLYGLEVGRQFISGGTCDTVLVIGADKLSALIDWTDRNTCVLFGDGAGAAVLRSKPGAHGLLTTVMGANGDQDEILNLPGGGSRFPITEFNVNDRLNTIKMAGKEVFKQAVNIMLQAAQEALERSGLTTDDIACFIPHQANIRIIEAIADRMKVPMDRFMINLDRYGNTSAAAVAIALDEAHRSGRVKPGDHILMVVFGGGLTWASTVVHW